MYVQRIQIATAFCIVDFSATGRSPVQRSPAEYGVSECDGKTSTMCMPRLTGDPQWKVLYKHEMQCLLMT